MQSASSLPVGQSRTSSQRLLRGMHALGSSKVSQLKVDFGQPARVYEYIGEGINPILKISLRLTKTTSFILPIGAIHVTVAKSIHRESFTTRAVDFVTSVLAVDFIIAPVDAVYAHRTIPTWNHILPAGQIFVWKSNGK